MPNAMGSQDAEGKTVLHFAAQRGNVALLGYIFSTNNAPDVNGRDCDGKSPMHYAVESRRAANTIETLSRYGADFGALDNEGRSPLHLAAKRDSLLVVQALLELCPVPTKELQVAGFCGMRPAQLAEYSQSGSVLQYLNNIRSEQRAEFTSRQQSSGEDFSRSQHSHHDLPSKQAVPMRGRWRLSGTGGGRTACVLTADWKVLCSLGFALVLVDVIILLWILCYR